MKHGMRIFFSMLLVLSFCFCAVPVAATDTQDTATFMVGDTVFATTDVRDGRATTAAVPGIVAGFCGWQATVGTKTIFLPANTVCTGLSGNVTFHAVTVGFETDAGSSVRLRDDQVALRFTSTILTADYEKLAALSGGASHVAMGTYIVPARYVTDTKGIFTIEALEAKGHYQRIDVRAGGFFKATDTTSTIAGSVGNIKRNNYTLEYTAVGYMKFTYTDGTQGHVYAAYNQKNNSCSILETVLSAYNDRDEAYGNLVIEATGSTHSPYTNTELALCRAFLDRVVLVGHDAKYNYFPLSTGYYITPWKITFSSDSYGRNLIFAEPPAGWSADSAMGVYLDGLRISMNHTKVENGRLVFEHDSFVGVN